MGVTGLLVRAGAARPHVLVAAMPGGTAVRLAAEEQLRHRGWPAALSPADADVLLVAGAPAADINASVQAAWAAVLAPRVRTLVTSPGEVAAALDAAHAELATGAPRWLPGGDGAILPGGDGGAASGPPGESRSRAGEERNSRSPHDPPHPGHSPTASQRPMQKDRVPCESEALDDAAQRRRLFRRCDRRWLVAAEEHGRGQGLFPG